MNGQVAKHIVQIFLQKHKTMVDVWCEIRGIPDLFWWDSLIIFINSYSYVTTNQLRTYVLRGLISGFSFNFISDYINIFVKYSFQFDVIQTS